MCRKVYLVPRIYEGANPWGYCNYARMNREKEVCLTCQNNCQHKGKHTIILIHTCGWNK